MTRRTWLSTAAGSQLAAFASLAQQSGNRVQLGLDTYSIRSLNWKAPQLIDYAGSMKLDTLQIGSLEEYESLESAYLQQMKDRAARLGMWIEQGIGSICPTSASWNPKNGAPEDYILRGLTAARTVGSKAMRCFVGSRAERLGPKPVDVHIESTLNVLKNVRTRAQDSGVIIAIENHNGDLTARELRSIVETAGKDFVGINYDSANPMWLLEDPAFTLETLAPYIVTSHFRDTALYEHPRGAAFQWVAMGEGSIGLDKVVALYGKLCPGKPVQLEIITGRPPQLLPYLEEDFWKAFPKMPAQDFARFTQLVKKGRPFEGSMIVAGSGEQPPAYKEALKEQQKVDLERSFVHCRKQLGLGLRSS